MTAPAAQPREPQGRRRRAIAARTVLRGVTLGVAAGDRDRRSSGRNGDGKSTLLRADRAASRSRTPGRVTRAGGLALALLGQGDDLDPRATVREELVGGRADHEWAGDARFRDVLDGLLGGVDDVALPATGSIRRSRRSRGGERRRIALAKTLLGQPRAAAAGRADEPPRRRGRGLARAAPRGAPRLDARRHPRSLVPRRGLHAHLGGRRRRRAPVRGRLRGVRAGAGRARAPGRGARGPAPAAAAQGARLAAARAAGAHVEAASSGSRPRTR